ncbi:MAG: ATP-binding protein [Spirochaetes bacterium]|nr:ATP-binding protein [Spirochaetota bacterium]
MIQESYAITGGNYKNAGFASNLLKTRLKRVGIEPEVLRKIMIAAYEAEMNVVIHADRGTMRVALDDGYLDMEVKDEGPGIPDIGLAMKEGYSTAPETARDMGFGAGMGLPNIKRNSDFFRIESAVGKGTCIRATIQLRPHGRQAPHKNSISVREDLCSGCLSCVRACPTGAVRVHSKRPEILAHRCIDCTACIETCTSGAIQAGSRRFFPSRAERGTVVVPLSVLAQFGESMSPRLLIRYLKEEGFSRVLTETGYKDALKKEILSTVRRKKDTMPVISPVCPAVVNLVETRFPSLIPDLAPYMSPIDALVFSTPQRPLLCIVPCPAQLTLLRSRYDESEVIVVAVDVLYDTVGKGQPSFGQKGHAGRKRPDEENGKKNGPSRQAEKEPMHDPNGILVVSGMKDVVDILERMENGCLRDVPAVEPYACRYGCFGSPLLRENPAFAIYRAGSLEYDSAANAAAIRKTAPYTARQGIRLHPNLSEAVLLLGKIDDVLRTLPGKDCGLCGAPGCDALAEDIVLGRAQVTDCVHFGGNQEKNP